MRLSSRLKVSTIMYHVRIDMCDTSSVISAVTYGSRNTCYLEESKTTDDETLSNDSSDPTKEELPPSAANTSRKGRKTFTFRFRKVSDEGNAASQEEDCPSSKVSRMQCVEVTTDTLHLLPETSTPKKHHVDKKENDDSEDDSNTTTAAADSSIYEMSPIFKSFRSTQTTNVPVTIKSVSDADDKAEDAISFSVINRS